MLTGEHVHGEFTSADASTAAVVTLYTGDGVARALVAGERLVIQSFHVVVGASGLTVTLFDDRDADGTADAGEIIARGTFAANGSLSESGILHYCKQAVTANVLAPKVKTSGAGQVDVVLRGFIIKS